MPRGAFERLRLNVKGVNSAALPYGFGKKFGIIPVTHGKIGGNVARVQMRQYELLVQ